MSDKTLRLSQVKNIALALGFDRIGITSAHPFPEAEEAMLARLPYLKPLGWLTPERVRLSCRPREILPTGRSIISLAVGYESSLEVAEHPDPTAGPSPARKRGAAPPSRRGKEAGGLGPPRGRLARYAWGPDYHTVLGQRLRSLVAGLRALWGDDLEARTFVDTGPLAERAIAMRAGLGWQGKNCTLITPTHGSWVFLAEVLVNVEVEPDANPSPNLSPAQGKEAYATALSRVGEGAKGLGPSSCDNCDRCLRACPTGALCAPYTIDVARCLSYLTVEHRGSIPRDERPALGNRVFGCDICQEACPINARLKPASSALFPPDPSLAPGLDLLPLLSMSEEEYRRRYQHSALKRAKRSGLRRNAAVALGNLGDEAAVPALAQALEDPDEVVREHAAWALERLQGKAAH